jgi:hypothetical protein
MAVGRVDVMRWLLSLGKGRLTREDDLGVRERPRGGRQAAKAWSLDPSWARRDDMRMKRFDKGCKGDGSICVRVKPRQG